MDKYVLLDDGEGLALWETDGEKPVRLVATDGGEPEDQTFGRDWNWVPSELNRQAETIAELRTQLSTAQADAQGLREQVEVLRESANADQAVIVTQRRRAKCAEDDLEKLAKEVQEALAPMRRLYDLMVLSESDSFTVPITTFRRLNEWLADVAARAALEGRGEKS